MMYRIALIIEYDGSNYHGLQIQKNSIYSTIQQQLEIAISKVANHPVDIVCAGRTDAKVHATYQIIHFDTVTQRKMSAWVFGVNNFLPLDIRILSSKEVSLDFNARKSALLRTYNYYIYNSQIRNSLFRNYLAWEYQNLNVDCMQQAANYWLGEHDFSSFRGKDCQSRSSIRKIYLIKCCRLQNLVKISITANAFLKHMVRNMVGVLIKIGQIGPSSVPIAKKILLARDRKAASVTAKPQGLYLSYILYPNKFKFELLKNLNRNSYFEIQKIYDNINY